MSEATETCEECGGLATLVDGARYTTMGEFVCADCYQSGLREGRQYKPEGTTLRDVL